MTHQPEKEPDKKPESAYFTGSRRVRIAKGVGVVALCIFAGGGYTLLQGNVEPNIHSKVVSQDSQPIRAHDLDGKEIPLEPGDDIYPFCHGPNGYRFYIDDPNFGSTIAAEGLTRAQIEPLEDPFHADQAPGGPQARLVPLPDC